MGVLDMSHFARTLVSGLLALLVGTAAAQGVIHPCGPLQNAFGPLDYRTASRSDKQLVEGAHFTPPVEALISGATAHRPGGDIDYTLRVFPNNPRALLAVIRLGEKENTDKPSGMRYSVECWLDRAVRFQPGDVVVRMIRAGYFGKRTRKAEALAELQVVERIAEPDNAFTQYNLGMSYFELGEHERALSFAHKALAMGLPHSDLREMLRRVGHWQEPVPDSAAASASSASNAASVPARRP